MKIIASLTLSACFAASALAQSQEYNGEPGRGRAAPAATDQIIIKWRAKASTTSAARMQKLSSASGMQLQHKGRITAQTDVLKLEQRLEAASMDEVLARLNADPDVEYAAPDERRYAHALPSDPLFAQQWYFQSVETAATRAEHAWDDTTGSQTTIVAVLDTGVRFEHPDLGRLNAAGKLLDGYDFVTNPAFANDGDGRDSDASDPGDWVSIADRQQPQFAECDQSDSSWHGTRVSSLIGALTNEAAGMAGSGWSTVLLPVRVLGKCGGTDSDIIAAMRWAGGLEVFGAPVNPQPAKIINISLGSDGICTPAYRSTISELSAQGVLVVASAGNEGGPISAPANCPGVLAVTGLRHAGTKVGYSSLGPEAGIGAPAGNCVNSGPGQPCLYSILAATDSGTTGPTASTWTNQFNFNIGTSFSAPIVAGAAALMHAVNAQLSPPHYITLLRESASPFPTSSATTTTVCHVPTGAGDVQGEECICTTQTCGAGMLNTQAAVAAARNPFAFILPIGVVATGADITIDGRSSVAANGRSIASYQWSALNVTGAAPAFAAPSQSLTTFQVSGNSKFTLRLTVTDDQGTQDTTDVAVSTPNSPTTPPPTTTPPPSSNPSATPLRSGGGGGSPGVIVLAGLGVLSVLRRCRRRPSIAAVR